MIAVIIVLMISTLVCAFGWAANYIAAKAVVHYMIKNGYQLPTKEEIKECTNYSAKHTLGLKF